MMVDPKTFRVSYLNRDGLHEKEYGDLVNALAAFGVISRRGLPVCLENQGVSLQKLNLENLSVCGIEAIRHTIISMEGSFVQSPLLVDWVNSIDHPEVQYRMDIRNRERADRAFAINLQPGQVYTVVLCAKQKVGVNSLGHPIILELRQVSVLVHRYAEVQEVQMDTQITSAIRRARNDAWFSLEIRDPAYLAAVAQAKRYGKLCKVPDRAPAKACEMAKAMSKDWRIYCQNLEKKTARW